MKTLNNRIDGLHTKVHVESTEVENGAEPKSVLCSQGVMGTAPPPPLQLDSLHCPLGKVGCNFFP